MLLKIAHWIFHFINLIKIFASISSVHKLAKSTKQLVLNIQVFQNTALRMHLFKRLDINKNQSPHPRSQLLEVLFDVSAVINVNKSSWSSNTCAVFYKSLHDPYPLTAFLLLLWEIHSVYVIFDYGFPSAGKINRLHCRQRSACVCVRSFRWTCFSMHVREWKARECMQEIWKILNACATMHFKDQCIDTK